MADTAYYKPLPNNRSYAVCSFSSLDCPIKELYIEDFVSLDDKEWLNWVVVDIVMNLIDESKEYQILLCEGGVL